MDREERSVFCTCAINLSAQNCALRIATAFSKGIHCTPWPIMNPQSHNSLCRTNSSATVQSNQISTSNTACSAVCNRESPWQGLWILATCPTQCWCTCGPSLTCGTPSPCRLCRVDSPTSRITSCLRWELTHSLITFKVSSVGCCYN